MKKKKVWKARLPMDAVDVLRHKGGAHSSPRGKRGYDRNKNKKEARKVE
jgi:hypothetical protein